MSSSLSCLQSLENVTPSYLNFSVCLRVTPFVWREQRTGCYDKHMISVLTVLSFISASKLASENRSSAYWRSLLFKLNNAKSSANSRCQTLHSPNVMPLLEKLSLSILFMYIMKRRPERTQPCLSSTLLLDLRDHKSILSNDLGCPFDASEVHH